MSEYKVCPKCNGDQWVGYEEQHYRLVCGDCKHVVNVIKTGAQCVCCETTENLSVDEEHGHVVCNDCCEPAPPSVNHVS